ncbi:MAG: DUF5125 domain-containing protein [Bacteroidales bacterium]|nr:DUF5125 domain-containing protein [Bacteroidales bacterium]
MKRLIIATALALAALTACQPEVRQVKFTDKGPDITVQSIDETAYMGGNIQYAVDLRDAEFPLSTLKIELLYDESVVESQTVRTKEYGVYEGLIPVPFYAKIPDGTATLRLTAQNTGLGISTLDLDIDVKRPDFDKLYASIDGKEVAIPRVAKFKYALKGSFPANAATTLRTPAVNSRGDVIEFGWDGSAINVSSTPIPFKMGSAGVYTIEADLWELSVSPLGRLTLELPEGKTEGVFNLMPDTPLQVTGIPSLGDWDLDYDFFNNALDGTVTFKAIAGLYKFSFDFDSKWINVEAMEDEKNVAKFSGANAQAIWAIGANIGKPVVGPGWNAKTGAYCLAQVAPGVHQLSLVYGSQLNSGFSFKFFYEKALKDGFIKYADVDDATGLFKVTGTGNIEASGKGEFDAGMGYRFTIDATGGKDAAVLSIKAVKLVEGLSFSINGVKAKGAGDTYKVNLVTLKQGEPLSVTGEVGLDGFVPDPDFITADGKFNAVDGDYAIEVYLDAAKKNLKHARFWRLDAEGNNANLSGGGCYFMGGTVAFIYQNGKNGWPGIVAWPGAGGLQMAQVKPGVFQVSGYAVAAGNESVEYARWQTEAMNVKYFYQDTWGGEATDGQRLTERAAAFLEVNHPLEGQDPGNIYLKEGVTLEDGAFYVMTIDFTECNIVGTMLSSGVELIDFYKK